jgi:hypothetical protein
LGDKLIYYLEDFINSVWRITNPLVGGYHLEDFSNAIWGILLGGFFYDLIGGRKKSSK